MTAEVKRYQYYLIHAVVTYSALALFLEDSDDLGFVFINGYLPAYWLNISEKLVSHLITDNCNRFARC